MLYLISSFSSQIGSSASMLTIFLLYERRHVDGPVLSYKQLPFNVMLVHHVDTMMHNQHIVALRCQCGSGASMALPRSGPVVG